MPQAGRCARVGGREGEPPAPRTGGGGGAGPRLWGGRRRAGGGGGGRVGVSVGGQAHRARLSTPRWWGVGPSPGALPVTRVWLASLPAWLCQVCFPRTVPWPALCVCVCVLPVFGLSGIQLTPLEHRERERDYTYPALRLIQVLPGHPLADSKDETVSSLQRRTSL